jgi:hypothetical protein
MKEIPVREVDKHEEFAYQIDAEYEDKWKELEDQVAAKYYYHQANTQDQAYERMSEALHTIQETIRPTINAMNRDHTWH